MTVRLIKLVLKAFGVIVTLLVALITIAILVLDDNDYRKISIYLAERFTGRTVAIDGPFSLTVSMHPTLSVSGVRIDNPSWATQPYLAQIGHLNVQMSLRQLLLGKLSVPLLAVSDAQVNLEINADGLRSWTNDTRRPEPTTKSFRVPAFGDVKLKNFTGRYLDTVTGLKTVVELTTLSIDEVDALNQLNAQGRWNDRAFSASGSSGTLADALESTKPFPVDMAMSLVGLDLTMKGTIAEPTDGDGLDIHVTALSSDVSKIGLALGEDTAVKGQLTGSADLRRNLAAPEFANINLTVTGGQKQPTASTKIVLTGDIAGMHLGGQTFMDGVDIKAGVNAPSTVISHLLNAHLPDLGPVESSFSLTGSSKTLRVSNTQLKIGDGTDLTIAATGGVTALQIMPALAMSGLDFQLRASAPTVADAVKPIGLTLPDLGPVSASAQLSGDLQQLDLDQIDLRVGGSIHPMQATGKIENILIQGNRPADVAITGAVTPWLVGLVGRKLPDLGIMNVAGQVSRVAGSLQFDHVQIVADDTDILSIKATSAAVRDPKTGRAALDIDIAAKNLEVVGSIIGLRIPALGPFSYSGRLMGKLGALSTIGKGRLGQTVFTENLSATLSGARPRVSGQVSIPVLYLADIGIHPDGPWQSSAPDDARTKPRALPFGALRAVDLVLLLDIDQIEGHDMSIDRGRLDLALETGVLQIKPLRFDTVGGSFTIDANVDARSLPTQITVDAAGENIVLEQVFKQVQRTVPLDGELDFLLKLNSSGDTLGELVSTLEGSTDFAISRGHIYNRYFDLLGSSLIHWLLLGREVRSAPDLRCFVGQFAIDAGDARVRTLLLETASTISRASGNIDFADKTLDVLVRPHSLTSQLLITTPYQVEGPWSAPRVRYSELRVAARLVAELALSPILTIQELAHLLRGRKVERDNLCLEWGPTPTELAPSSASDFKPGSPGYSIDPVRASSYVALTDTHLRHGPGTNFAIAKTFAPGETMEVTGKLRGLNWYTVTMSHERQGYVWGKLIRPAN
ncbi:MAG: AsmA family protein [Sedimentitalea sp.]|uniref:AsmA family protein n=1 Tax=Sedimentitalea sp. TaxID=2048915 RepID=UPI003263C4F0